MTSSNIIIVSWLNCFMVLHINCICIICCFHVFTIKFTGFNKRALAGLHSTVRSASDSKSKDRKFESQRSHIPLVEIDHGPFLQSFSPFLLTYLSPPTYRKGGVLFLVQIPLASVSASHFRVCTSGWIINKFSWMYITGI